MIDFDEIRKEVAVRHNVLLGKDDPILVTVTVNDLVLSHYAELVNQKATENSRELSLALQQQLQQSKEIGGKVITDAADYVAKQAREAVELALRDAGAGIRQQVADSITASREANASSHAALSAKSGAWVAAAVAGAAAVLALFALSVVLLK
ncbi:conjugal transfer protein TraM [Allopusillimonas ginsengisoli]|uniref:conjugal transfer protein TraM n=1 Tax=Allopusillimonas ginsengisoli TaxID=453575 RepID=UPI0039C2511C